MVEQNEPGSGENAGSAPPEGKIPAYKQEKIPSGTVNQIMWYAFRGKTRKELERPPYNFKAGSIRSSFGKLKDSESGWVETLEKPEVKGEGESGKQLPAVQQKGMQIFAKGSPPEAIIESIKLPQVDGQAEGFEKGMKFGMSTIVLAVRIMQELSAEALQQVQPLIALTRSVREGEQAAFKGGADEGALKAARAMGDTILPMMSEIQAGIAGVANIARGTEADPLKSMFTRAMEPILKNLMAKMVPGIPQDQTPQDWVRKSE